MTIALFGYDKDHDIAVHGYSTGQAISQQLSSGIPFAKPLPIPKFVKDPPRIKDISFLVVVNHLKLDSQFSLTINRIKEKLMFNVNINLLDLSRVYNIIVNRVIVKVDLFSLVIKPIKTKKIVIEKFKQIIWDSKSGEID